MAGDLKELISYPTVHGECVNLNVWGVIWGLMDSSCSSGYGYAEGRIPLA